MMDRFTKCCLFILFVIAFSVPAAKAKDKPLIVELLPKTIAVDSRFNGTNIFLFGVKPKSGDIIITLRGPEEPMVVRRKRRAVGIWINDDSVAFRDVPQFYALASTRPINDLMAVERLSRHQIGIDQILLNTIWIRTIEEVNAFRNALRGGDTALAHGSMDWGVAFALWGFYHCRALPTTSCLQPWSRCTPRTGSSCG